MINRVVYLARARGLARVVLAQIEFTRAILWLTQYFANVTVMLLYSNRKMHAIISARQWTVHYWSLHRS